MDAQRPGSGRTPVETLLADAFAPLHRRALGVALGLTAGAGVFLLTAFHIVFQPAGALPLDLLSQYFYGYRVDWMGAGVGAMWAALSGFVAGWLLAFVRNTVVTVWWRTTRMKAELQQTRDFLDHV
jgi:hypothetical protein